MAGVSLDQPSTFVTTQTSLHRFLCEHNCVTALSLLFNVITVIIIIIIISILIWQCWSLHMLYVLEHLLVVNVQTQQQQTGVVC